MNVELNAQTARNHEVHNKTDNGFVLIAVLWIFIGIGVLAFAAAFASRSAAATARNRSALTETHWKSYGCLERARAAAHLALTAVYPEAVAGVWDSLDRVISASPLLTGTTCKIQMRATSGTLNINTASEQQLHRLFSALDIAPTRIDSLTAALLDWRDIDDFPRPMGAERDWYEQVRRPIPRNAAFADPHELLRVRGFEQFGDTLLLISTDPGRYPLSHTPAPVLMSLSGMTPEAVAKILDFRARNERITELIIITTGLPASARDTLMAHYAELARQVATEPDRWSISATVSGGTPMVQSTAELRVARAGTRVAIMGRQ